MISLLKELDIKIIECVNSRCRNKTLDKLMKFITALGNLGFIWIIIAGYFLSNKDSRQQGWMIISSLVLTTIVGEGILKHIVKRERPFVKLDSEDELIIAPPITYSFPSGHTGSSFAVSAVFMSTFSAMSIFVVILAILIAFSRLYLKVHYPSDVLGGGIIGLICGSIVVVVFRTMILI